MPPNDKGRPGEKAAPAQNSAASLHPIAGAVDELAKHVNGAFVVVVETSGGRFHRRAFLTVAPAERAANNAIAKGYQAKVYLAELKPLWRLYGGGLDD
jgi:hypothetical protein